MHTGLSAGVIGLIAPEHRLRFAVIAAIVGAVIAYRVATKRGGADDKKTASDVWLGIGNALFAGGALALVLAILQQSVRDEIDKARAESEFRTRISLSPDLRGFAPVPTVRMVWTGTQCRVAAGSRDDLARIARFAGWSFTAKNLEGARLDGMQVQQASFRDARLVGATLVCTSFEGSNLQRANLSGAVLSGASLARADLRGTRLDGAIADVRDWSGALVDASTCWPEQGPWGRQRVDRWMNAHAVEATALGKRPPAFGHFCSGRPDRVIYPTGTRVEKDVPPAMGRTDIYEENRWREAMLEALRALAPPQRAPASP